MQKVPITLVKPGMVLAKAVLNETGMPLCAEGTELTEPLLDRLRRMNVAVLTLKGTPVDMGSPVKGAEELVREMTERFAKVDGDPLMDRIREAIARAIVEESAQEREEEGEVKEEPGE